jgi:hypothetical protein
MKKRDLESSLKTKKLSMIKEMFSKQSPAGKRDGIAAKGLLRKERELKSMRKSLWQLLGFTKKANKATKARRPNEALPL